MKYRSGKNYGHEIGLSAAFRQWKADSHCRFFHGYALAVEFEFGSNELDVRNWVVDFGGLKNLKGILEDTFDHKLLVAEDDPFVTEICEMENVGLAQVRILPAVGCEKFAEYIWHIGDQWLRDAGYGDRVKLLKVTVREHGANWAAYTGEEA